MAWSNRPNGDTELVNARLCQYVGVSPERLLPDPWFQMVHPDDLSRVQSLRNASIVARKPYYQELRFRRADGVFRWHSLHVAPIRDVEGSLIAWYGSALDIDDRKRESDALRESEARFRAVFESAAIGVARVAFEDARWLEVNDAFCRILGYPREELIDRPWPQFTHPDDIDADLKQFTRMAAGDLDSYIVEKRFIHKTGHPVWVRLTLSLVRDGAGKPEFEVCLVEDITDRKQAQEALQRSNEDLQRFGYVVSHDLHEPLRQVAIFSELMARKFGHLDREAEQYARQVVAGAQRMQVLIQDLLLLAGPESEIPAERFNAADAVQAALGAVQHHLEQTGGEVIVEQPLPEIVAPLPIVRQTLQNLLSNAIKYRQDGRAPRICVGGSRRDREWIFFVADNGQGIPAEYRDKLFHWFSRVPGTNAAGQGIGLANVDRMLQRIGGRIWLESRIGEGSTFYFAIPVPEEGHAS